MADITQENIAKKIHEIPEHYLGMVIHFFMHFHNDTTDFKTPHLRPALKNVFPLYLVLYGLVGAAGLFLNANMLRRILLRRKHCENIEKYLASNALNDMFKCIVVMPVSLATLALQNWILGRFLCHFLPIAQDVPFYATFLTFLSIAFDRYKAILNPLKPRNIAGFWLLGTWVSSFLVALPYSVYSEYVDLEKYFGEQFKGVGICVVNVENNIEEFIRALFIVLYATPAVLIMYLHLKVTVEINNRNNAFHSNGQRSQMLSHEDISVSSVATSSVMETRKSSAVPLPVGIEDVSRGPSSDTAGQSLGTGVRRYRHQDDDDFDWDRERVVQKCFFMMALFYAFCLFPLHVTRLVKHVVTETVEHTSHFDLAFINVVLIALLPTIVTPVLHRSMDSRGAPRGDSGNYLTLKKHTSNLSLQRIGSEIHEDRYKKPISPTDKLCQNHKEDGC
ncbi:neuropeptide Y receptor type 5-like [Limulus polyphemus]|uniref:Neuropeptide Y receptor type 5-like n=1 Tax=Limulus polyphemus TaxID=6850 RepID=A0ABM1BXE1_LIMPO|nr:neuropeptide Y receptor type 5-like [Limulus polyphemus]